MARTRQYEIRVLEFRPPEEEPSGDMMKRVDVNVPTRGFPTSMHEFANYFFRMAWDDHTPPWYNLSAKWEDYSNGKGGIWEYGVYKPDGKRHWLFRITDKDFVIKAA